MTFRRAALFACCLPFACGGGGGGGTIDAPHVDAPAEAIGDAFCGADFFYTGEYVDWDSSDTGEFLGIFNATWAVENDSASRNTAHTAPNGRFLLCTAPQDTITDITPDPTNGGSDGSDVYLPGVALGKHQVLARIPLTSARSMRMSRVATMFAQIGSAYDPAAGQVFVHQTNTTGTLSLSAAHAATQAYGDTMSWSAGDSGTYVFFPNVATGTATLTSSDTAAIGTGAFPVAAGKITYLEVAAP